MAIRLRLAPRPLAGHEPRRPRRRRQDARHANLAAADPNDADPNYADPNYADLITAGVSRVTGILRAAECNKAPFMYEMKGALSGHGPGSAGFPASRLRLSQSPGLTVPVRLVSQPHRSRSTGHPASLFRFARISRLPVRFTQLPRRTIRFARLPGLPSATRRPPVPDTRCKFRFPGLSIAPGKPPGWCPFPAVKVFLRPSRASRKSSPEFILSFFRLHILSTGSRRLSARRSGYPPPYAQLLHRSLDVTQRIPSHDRLM
jgi:hypothetical protein